MLTRLSRWLRSRITGRIALLGLLIFLVFGATVLPAQSNRAQAASAGAGSPDISLYYSPDALLSMAEAYGEAGRAEYVRVRWTFDLAFPAVYGFFYLTAITWLFGKGFRPDSPWQRLNLVPIGGVFFDLLENTATSIVMASYPRSAAAAAALAPWFTLVKWILVGGSSALLVLGVAAAVYARFRQRRTA